MNEAEAMANDTRIAAIHEAGHAVVARRFGVPTHAELRKNPAGGEDVPLVGGWTRIFGKPPTPTAAAQIGLAGAVAELYAIDAGVDADTIADAIECGDSGFSERDAKIAGQWTVEDVERCLSLVKEAWPEIGREAEWLEKTL